MHGRARLVLSTIAFLPAAKPTGQVEVSWFLFLLSAIWSKKVKTAKTKMVAYVEWAMNFKSDFRFDLRGCFEAVLASKPQSFVSNLWKFLIGSH